MDFVWNTLVRLFWKARFGKVNICGADYCLSGYLPWRWGLRWKFGVVFWYWSPLDTSSGKWGQPFRRWCTKTIWRPVNYSAKYKWRWRCPRYCIGAGPRESRAHHPASLENWNSSLYCRMHFSTDPWDFSLLLKINVLCGNRGKFPKYDFCCQRSLQSVHRKKAL